MQPKQANSNSNLNLNSNSNSNTNSLSPTLSRERRENAVFPVWEDWRAEMKA